MRHIFQLQGKSLLFGLIILGALGAALSRQSVPPQETTLDIAIQHEEALALGIDMTTKSGSSLITLTADSKANILISIPDAWKRTQVRNTTLAQVIAKDRSLGFIQWEIPAGATVTYLAPDAPDHFHILNLNEKLMNIHYRRVDLSTGHVTDRSVLLSGKATIL